MGKGMTAGKKKKNNKNYGFQNAMHIHSMITESAGDSRLQGKDAVIVDLPNPFSWRPMEIDLVYEGFCNKFYENEKFNQNLLVEGIEAAKKSLYTGKREFLENYWYHLNSIYDEDERGNRHELNKFITEKIVNFVNIITEPAKYGVRPETICVFA